MSYDIWLEIDTGGVEPVVVPGSSWNYTSNSVRAWREAGADLAEFHDKTAAECAPILAAAIEVMRSDPIKYKAFDAANGWGSYETLIPALNELYYTLKRHPKATVKVWR